MSGMADLKDKLRTDLTASIRARDEVRSSTLRMALTAVKNEEVSGKSARELSDDEVVGVLVREAKKRRESAEAYDAADRPELADRERAELVVLDDYLPQQLTEAEVDALVSAAVAKASADGLEGGRAMGAVMKGLNPQVSGRFDGGQVAAKVKAALGM
jgi:uncharacterized protein